MPVIEANCSLKPESVASCKRTYVVAKGRATFVGKTSAAAVKGATAAAISQRTAADILARRLRCPETCGAGARCVDSGLTKQGFGLDWTVPVKNPVTKTYRCRAWAYHSYYKHCRCRPTG